MATSSNFNVKLRAEIPRSISGLYASTSCVKAERRPQALADVSFASTSANNIWAKDNDASPSPPTHEQLESFVAKAGTDKRYALSRAYAPLVKGAPFDHYLKNLSKYAYLLLFMVIIFVLN